jgi:hypothetical protein
VCRCEGGKNIPGDMKGEEIKKDGAWSALVFNEAHSLVPTFVYNTGQGHVPLLIRGRNFPLVASV